MNFIEPITITDAMIGAGTSIAEPAAGETAWVSAASYTAGDEVIRTTTHRRYIALQTHTGRTALPENDTAYWSDLGPTQRWAPFDQYISTGASATTTITYVLSPGYFNSFALYGLVGTAISITVKDAPAGTTIYSYSAPLLEDPAGWYEYLFLEQKPITKLIKNNIPIRPTAEFTVTVTAASGQPVGIGLINIGDIVYLAGDSVTFGGTEGGATAEPVTYSYIKTDEFGNTEIVRRNKSTSMQATLVLPRRNADDALRKIQEVLDVPVSWTATSALGYQGLNVFGLGSARVVYENAEIAKINLTVKGMI